MSAPATITLPPRLVLTDASRQKLFTLQPNGAFVRVIRPNVNQEYWFKPVWSSTGRIAVAKTDGIGGQRHLILMDGDGSNVSELGYDPKADLLSSMVWSPDGTKIAVPFLDANGDLTSCTVGISIHHVDGSGYTRVVLGSGLSYSEALELVWVNQPTTWDPNPQFGLYWSPDGTKFACTVLTDAPVTGGDNPWGVAVFNADGSGHTTVLTPTVRPDGTAGSQYFMCDWYSDSQHLLVSRNPFRYNWDFIKVALDGTIVATPVTDNSTSLTGYGTSTPFARVSPDDSKIAIAGDYGLYIVSATATSVWNNSGDLPNRVFSRWGIDTRFDWGGVSVDVPNPARGWWPVTPGRAYCFRFDAKGINEADPTVDWLTASPWMDFYDAGFGYLYSNLGGSLSHVQDGTPVSDISVCGPAPAGAAWCVPYLSTYGDVDRYLEMYLDNAYFADVTACIPTITTIADQENWGGDVVSLQATATPVNPADPIVSYTDVGTLPSGVSIDATTGAITGTIGPQSSSGDANLPPSDTQYGPVVVTIRAITQRGLVAQTTFRWTLRNPALFGGFADLYEGIVGQALALPTPVRAYPAKPTPTYVFQRYSGSPNYTYTTVAAPAGMTFAADGTLSGTPTAIVLAQGGSSFAVVATTPDGSTCQFNFGFQIAPTVGYIGKVMDIDQAVSVVQVGTTPGFNFSNNPTAHATITLPVPHDIPAGHLIVLALALAPNQNWTDYHTIAEVSDSKGNYWGSLQPVAIGRTVSMHTAQSPGEWQQPQYAGHNPPLDCKVEVMIGRIFTPLTVAAGDSITLLLNYTANGNYGQQSHMPFNALAKGAMYEFVDNLGFPNPDQYGSATYFTYNQTTPSIDDGNTGVDVGAPAPYVRSGTTAATPTTLASSDQTNPAPSPSHNAFQHRAVVQAMLLSNGGAGGAIPDTPTWNNPAMIALDDFAHDANFTDNSMSAGGVTRELSFRLVTGYMIEDVGRETAGNFVGAPAAPTLPGGSVASSFAGWHHLAVLDFV